ncbi:hypothetical protein MNBD_NITROSPINAE03-1012 [hydrothermal vent metagenome]|uniref:Uncharacterized protein n=1 Tax=hydrothermal vent metagenome TaxID=652676 RepID=A0A3B1C8X7_9ZZZZ
MTKYGRLFHLFPILILAVIGVSRIYSFGLSFEGMDRDHVREYYFHMSAGLFSGWVFYIGVSYFLGDISKRKFRSPELIAIVYPLVFLVLIHQTRDTINDGPGALAMAVGYLLTMASILIYDGGRQGRGVKA